MKKYYAKDDGSGPIDIGEHDSMEAACKAAWLEWRVNFEAGDSPRSVIDVWVWREDEPDVRECVWVEVGEDPPEPDCVPGYAHEWELYGDFPRWQLDDGRIETTERCPMCGHMRISYTESPISRSPWYPERVEYHDEWVEFRERKE
jgi:hypothetical protein